MAYKYTMIFKYISGSGDPGDLSLAGGWSESVYFDTFSDLKVTNFRTLALARALLLPLRSLIIGLRIQQVDPSRAAQTFAVNYPGSGLVTTSASDIPQMALLLRVRGQAVTNTRSMRLAAMPDPQIRFGEYKPTPGFRAVMLAYLALLSQWQFRGVDLTKPQIPLLSVDTNGVYTAAADFTPAPVGTVVRVTGIRDIDGNVVRGGLFRVQVATSLRVGTLRAWTAGNTTLGNISLAPLIYPIIQANEGSIARVVVRKIGRPSVGYRGRRSKKRV
jgi:hypothetical protein